MRHILCAIGAAIAISAGSAGAATMSYEVTGSSGIDSSAPFLGEPASFDVTASVDRFDGSRGTLVGVTVVYNLLAEAFGQSSIEGAGTVSATASGSVGESFFGPTTEITHLCCRDVKTALSYFIVVVDLEAKFWDSIIGPGTFDFIGTVAGAATGDVELRLVLGELDVRVIYTYTPADVTPPAAVIPLPAGLPLLLGALGALGGLSLLGRRRT